MESRPCTTSNTFARPLLRYFRSNYRETVQTRTPGRSATTFRCTYTGRTRGGKGGGGGEVSVNGLVGTRRPHARGGGGGMVFLQTTPWPDRGRKHPPRGGGGVSASRGEVMDPAYSLRKRLGLGSDRNLRGAK